MVEAENVLKPVLKKIAKEKEYDDYNTEVSLISSGGANYTSQLYNITLSAPGKDDIKLFSKVTILGEKFRSMSALPVFERELMFYTSILSQYRKYEEKYVIPAEDRLSVPKFYGASTDYVNEVLVLEDLTAKGYQSFNRFKCFDWEYASKCLSFLARFDALSVRYERDCPEEFGATVQKLAMKYPMDEMRPYAEKALASALEVTDDEYKEKLAKFMKVNATDEKFKAYHESPRHVILNHGDFKPSNIMHRTNDDGQLEVSLVDYQVLQKGTPVTDLMFFFISGSDEEFREKHFDQYFHHYYEEFSRALRMLEINPDEVYSRDQFDEDVKELLPFGIVLGALTLPFITVEEHNAPKAEDGFDLGNITIKSGNLFKQRFNGLLKDYAKKGIL